MNECPHGFYSAYNQPTHKVDHLIGIDKAVQNVSDQPGRRRCTLVHFNSTVAGVSLWVRFFVAAYHGTVLPSIVYLPVPK